MIDHITADGTRVLSRPFEYKKPGDEYFSYLAPLDTLHALRPITFNVGQREYTTFGSQHSLAFSSGSLYDSYCDYWDGRADLELINSHKVALAKESMIKFFPPVDNVQERILVEISDGLALRPFRSELFGERFVSEFIELMRDFGNFTANEVAAALTKRGIVWTATGDPGQSLGFVLSDYVGNNVYIPRSLFGYLFHNVIGNKINPQSAQIRFHPYFESLTGITFARFQELCPNLDFSGMKIGNESWNFPMTVAAMEEYYPDLSVARARLALMLGVDSAELTWGCPPVGSETLFYGFYLSHPSVRYSSAKSNILGGVLFDLLYDDNLDGSFASNQYNWYFSGSPNSSRKANGITFKANGIYCYYALDELVKRLGGEATTEIKSFASSNPGTAIAYSYLSKPMVSPGSQVLESTKLYQDSVKSNFNLYGEELFAGRNFKTASNKANELCTKSDSPLTMLVPGVFPSIEEDWTFTEYGLASWSFNNNGNVVGTLESKVVYLDAGVEENLDDIEVALRLSTEHVFETTEAEFLQLWFGVDEIGELSAEGELLEAVTITDYTLSPIALSPSGFVFSDSLSHDAYLRLIFVTANTTTKDLVGAVEAALAVHFIW